MSPKFPIAKYAFKSVLRNLQRNMFILGITACMSVFSIFTASIFGGKNKQIKDTIIATHTGHWQIFEKNYYLTQNQASVLSFSPELSQQLQNHYYSPELVLESTLMHPETSLAVTLLGIDLYLHEKLFPLGPHMIEGRLFGPDDGPKVVIGKELAEKLNLSVGESVLITYQDKDKALLNESLEITGIYHHFGPAFEGDHLFMDKKELQDLIGLKVENAFHRIVLLPKFEDQAPPPIAQPQLVMKSWDELNPELFGLMSFHDGITAILMMFMLVVTLASILTPINILWDAREGELRMLQVLGVSKWRLLGLGTGESGIIFLASTLIAWAFSSILLYWGMTHGVDFGLIGEETVIRSGIVLSNTVYPDLNWEHILMNSIFNFIVIFTGNIWCVKKRIKVAHEI